MATLKGKAQQSTAIARQSEGNDVYLRALRDGSLIQADWKQAGIMAGYGFHANLSSFTTGDTGGGVGATVIEVDGPELMVSIPNGTCILPIRVGVHVQHGTVSTQEEAEILIAVDQDTSWILANNEGNPTQTPIYNMNTLCGRSSRCLCLTAVTSTLTAQPALDIELARKVVEFDVLTSGTTAMDFDLVYEPKNPPVINGPAKLLVYFGGDNACASGFVDAQWLEFDETVFKL